MSHASPPWRWHAASPQWRWQTHAQLGSTQDAAIEAARQGDPGRLAILADRQSAGRGSRGRQWESPAGNLNLSLLLRPDGAGVEPGRWALLAGLALHRALSPHAPGLQLKWPNDLLLGRAKLGGILIDSEWQPAGAAAWVVIGLGANLRAAPGLPGREVAHLPPPAPGPLHTAQAVVAALDIWMACTLPEIRQAWLDRAHPIGTRLDVRTPQRHLAGAFAGLTERGELLIAGHPGPISSAEIFLPPAQGHATEPAPCC